MQWLPCPGHQHEYSGHQGDAPYLAVLCVKGVRAHQGVRSSAATLAPAAMLPTAIPKRARWLRHT